MSKSDDDDKPKRTHDLTKMPRPLNEQERKFVQARLSGKSIRESSRIAGYALDPSSERIQKALEKAVASQQRKLNGLRLKVVETLMDIAFGDPRELLEWQDDAIEIKNSKHLSPSALAMVSAVHFDTKGNVKVDFNNKWKALELLSRYLGMTEQKDVLKVEGPSGWVDMIKEAAIAAQEQRAVPETVVQGYIQGVVKDDRAVVDAEVAPVEGRNETK